MVHFGGDRLSIDGCDDTTQSVGTRVSPHSETGTHDRGFGRERRNRVCPVGRGPATIPSEVDDGVTNNG